MRKCLVIRAGFVKAHAELDVITSGHNWELLNHMKDRVGVRY